MNGTHLVDRAVRLALRWYPSWWRDRYGAEQEALVEDLESEQSRWAWSALGGWRLAGSFVVGATRARVSGSGMPAVPELWQRRTRNAVIAASVPAASAVPVALLLITHTSEYGRSAPGGTHSVLALSTAGQVAHWDLVVLSLLVLASVVQLLGGALRLARQLLALTPPRRRALLLAAVLAPVVAIGAGFVLLHLASSLEPIVGGSEKVRGHTVQVWYSRRGHPLVAALASWSGWIGVVGGWTAGSVVLARMASRRWFALRALSTGLGHARVVTWLQAGTALCVLVLAAALASEQPADAVGGMIYRSELGAWTPVVFAALLAAAALTWTATRAARRALVQATPAGG